MIENLAKDDLIILPNGDNHNCFGCSPHNSSGLKMEFYTNENQDAVYSWLTIPGHVCGWGNLVHGGIVATVLDEAMGWASVAVLKKFILTKTISVNFFKPIFVKQEICVVGNILKIVNDREAEIQAAIYDSNKKLSAKSSSTVALFTIDEIKTMGMFEKRSIEGIESIMKTLNQNRIH